MYGVVMYTSLDGCRMHQNCDYEAALKWIYDTKAVYTSVYVNAELLCKNVNYRVALSSIVRHHHAKTNPGPD
jgi:hypothetical protein